MMHGNRKHGAGMRDSAYNVEEIVEFLGIKQGDNVLDLGAGDGFFSKEFKKITDNVTALDIDGEYFNELEKLGIKTIKSDICEYHDGLYDMIFIANVYHGIRNVCKDKLLENLNKMAKKYVAIVDFNPERTMFGPPSSIRISKEKIIEEFQQHNFKFVKEKDLKYHYILIFNMI
jgi:16S rRNA A1518/A1519 N6-dimethyltransferase RsmA/KsgA/DIM1 with predicted DNA glycosylase/AP lyase activity